ncbi:MAG: hypothetical protein JWP85_1412 [Rhodoglobus sp.]|nr:hypothetical protein [Rhodoglobus sp.]
MTAPVRREVLVNAGPQRAFDLFTAHINAWWPLDRFGVFNAGTVSFEDARIVERLGEQESVWGEVTLWAPPDSLGFTWHPGYGVEHATDIRVTFTPEGDQTLVTLVHSGWERMTDPDASAEEYANGWPGVLARFAELVNAVPA